MGFVNQLEPDSLLEHFRRHPPEGFHVEHAGDGAPVFIAPFNLLTTADDALRQQVARWPFQRLLNRLLTWRTCFVGTTVSEYALFEPSADPAAVARRLRDHMGRACPLLVVKDVAVDSPLTSPSERAWSTRFVQAAAAAGYLIVEGQALAFVPMDFGSIDEYLGRMSASRRKNLKRKLRSRSRLKIDRVPTGAGFEGEGMVDTFYRLFENVHDQSDIHFDKPTRAFFAHVLRTPGGLVFTYRVDGRLIGWNLCFEHGGKLIDKYVGFEYPAAREHDLYFVSWFVNLEYALERQVTHYVAGWTDPAVKASLGATFHMTSHAVYVRHPWLRWVLRRLAHRFEGDSAWSAQHAAASRS